MQALGYQAAMDTSPQVKELFDSYNGMILQSAYRITGKAEDAEDVLQTVFMRLVGRTELPELGKGARHYLRRAAVNAALDVVRSRKSSPGVDLDSVQNYLPDHEGERPDLLGIASELRQWLRTAVGELNARAAEIFVLKSIEGYTNQEIAELLDTSPGTIAVTLHRTRSLLQAKLQSFLGG